MPTTKSLPNTLDQTNMTLEELEVLLERSREQMARKEILSHHPSPIEQLPNGRWYTRIDGRKFERKEREKLEDLIVSAAKKRNLLTLRGIFDDYLVRRKLEVAQTTWSKDIRYFNTFIATSNIADKALDTLTLADGYRFLEHCLATKEDLKRKYWNNIFGTLSTMIQFSIDEGYLSHNPFTNLRPRKDVFSPKSKTRDGDTVFSLSEQEQVCQLAELDSQKGKKAEPLGIILLFNLGLRAGELCALKWGDIEKNFRGQTIIHVQREQVIHMNMAGKNNGYEILDHCKTESGDRRLICNSKVVETLNQIKLLNKANGLSTTLDDFIFLRIDHNQIRNCTTRSFDPRLRKYCRQANMSVIKSCHDVRRTVLTRLYTNGMPLKKIQEFAGHSNLKQTMDYIRITDDDLDLDRFVESLADTSQSDNVVSFRKEA